MERLYTMNQEPRTMLTRNRITIIAVLLLLAVGGSYLYFRLIVGKRLTPQAGAKLIPDEATAMTFINTDPQPWSHLQNYGTPAAQEFWENNLEAFEQDSLNDSGIDYEEDIAPWLGGLAIAYFPSSNPLSSQEGDFLAIAGITNSLKAQQFFNSLEGEETVTLTQRQYEGVTIIEMETQEGDRASGARVDGYILFAEAGKMIEKAIDTARGEASFASQTEVQTMLSQGLTLDNPVIQVYSTDSGKLLQENLPQEIPPGVNFTQSFVTGVALEAEGIYVQSIALIPEEEEVMTLPPNDSKLLAEFPEDTIAVMNGHGLSEIWSDIVRQSQDNPFLRVGVEGMRQAARSLDLDLDEEVFAWLDGEYAIGLFPTRQSSLSDLPIAGGILIESSRREVGEKTLSKLGAIGRSNPFLTEETEFLGRTEVTTWLDPSQRTMLTYGWLEEERLMMTVATPFRTFAQKQGKNSLKDSSHFSAIAQRLPASNFGYVYFDMNRALSTLETLPQQPLATMPPEVKATLDSIQQIGVTLSQPDSSFSQLDAFMALESTSQP